MTTMSGTCQYRERFSQWQTQFFGKGKGFVGIIKDGHQMLPNLEEERQLG